MYQEENMANQRISTEVKVGILVIIAILALFYMTFRVGKFGLVREGGYELTVYFDNAAGIDPKTPVQIAGIDVGKVRSIKLDGMRAKVTLFIKSGVKIPSDSKIAVKSQGVLGDKYIELKPGTAERVFAQGDTITDVITAPDFDQILRPCTRRQGISERPWMNSRASWVPRRGRASRKASAISRP